MNLFNTDIAGQVSDAFTGELKPATITRVSKSSYDAVNDTQTTTETTDETEGFVEDYNERMKTQGVVQDNDRRIILIANELDITPSVGGSDHEPDTITIEGSDYTVVHVKRDPAGATFTIQGRF